jgi:hypothetical protein
LPPDPQETFDPGGTSLIGVTRITCDRFSVEAASNIPFDVSPRIVRGARFFTTIIDLPTRSSG